MWRRGAARAWVLPDALVSNSAAQARRPHRQWASARRGLASSMPSINVFDRAGKKRQRARAAADPDWCVRSTLACCNRPNIISTNLPPPPPIRRAEYQYLRAEVARRLVDRLEVRAIEGLDRIDRSLDGEMSRTKSCKQPRTPDRTSRASSPLRWSWARTARTSCRRSRPWRGSAGVSSAA